MSLGHLVKKSLKKAMPAVGTVAKLTPAGRGISLASKMVGGLKRVGRAGMAIAGERGLTGSFLSAVARRRKKRKFKGISGQEMLELMKLQMLVGKKSMPYQMAVMKAITGRLK